MPWMTRWPGRFPVFFDSASGARLTDVDGIEYVDLCLGDTGAMTGHALPQVTDAIAERAGRGITTMLPSADAVWVGEELARRFGLPSWQLAMSATDANRFVLRFARHLTGRPRIAVMDWCYHGTVDETLAVLDGDRGRRPRPGALGPQVDVAETTAVVPFNDLDALDRRLARRRRRLPADGAGADQHRHRAARAGLPRRRSARSPGGTACCWSSTRRTRCAPGPAARPPRGASSPTCWWSASRSAAASRARRTA